MEKTITRKRPTGLIYKSKNKDITEEEVKQLRKERNRRYYLKRKEMIENYKKILKN